MGYTHTLELNRDFTHEEFEDIRADIARIIDVAAELDIPLCGYEDDDPVMMSPQLIVFNGVGDEACQGFTLSREIEQGIYNPTLNFCKTWSRNYDPVVVAAIMAVKQRAPQDVMVRSSGHWGYEWLHGTDCHSNGREGTCNNVDPDHAKVSGRSLYRMAFPDSPEPRNSFESPLINQGMAGQLFYVTRDMECLIRGTCFVGLPFGVNLRILLEQSERLNMRTCMVCGEDTDYEIKVVSHTGDTNFDGRPMCEYCYRERLLKGRLTGYGYARNPFRLLNLSGNGLIFADEQPGKLTISPLRGLRVCATGRFSKMTRPEVNAYVESLGGIAQTSVSHTTDILVTGKRVGATKVNQARRYGVEVLSEDDFVARYG